MDFVREGVSEVKQRQYWSYQSNETIVPVTTPRSPAFQTASSPLGQIYSGSLVNIQMSWSLNERLYLFSILGFLREISYREFWSMGRKAVLGIVPTCRATLMATWFWCGLSYLRRINNRGHCSSIQTAQRSKAEKGERWKDGSDIFKPQVWLYINPPDFIYTWPRFR